ncbi:hypothetical protein ACFCV3_19595 [Kribbella sp. NPDC056345]|uniref:hypothetical protein n=1 Tax=Kribbella sp. NPDC056345 TaxID=3345789 RepID=UPI0035DB6770
MNLSGLPQVDDWVADFGDFGFRTFVLANVSIAEACSVATLLSPDFIEYNGCVVLEFVFDTGGIDAWIERFEGDRKAVEGVVNHIHLWDLFKPKSETESVALVQLAQQMAISWKVAAASQFPGRDFVVESSDGSDDYGPTVTIRTA